MSNIVYKENRSAPYLNDQVVKDGEILLLEWYDGSTECVQVSIEECPSTGREGNRKSDFRAFVELDMHGKMIISVLPEGIKALRFEEFMPQWALSLSKNPEINTLPELEFAAAVTDVGPSWLAIGVRVNHPEQTIEIFAADGTKHSSSFQNFLGYTEYPDFNDPEIIDWGQTLRLGEFETAVDLVMNPKDKRHPQVMFGSHFEHVEIMGTLLIKEGYIDSVENILKKAQDELDNMFDNVLSKKV